ncbi:FAD-dependent 5-carboxymethylaminomethyl-2-thiouridine(34) oxidoreductase MnmC [Ramlibacter rhizophilus]|uniref:FAD-dependent oxidoreductase n=1 Tax=Ramlibacter rhizophilus TaxID=1781167 RepID=A0A4Z0BZB3_9BURK|nr:FAD-dependent 5-carboxymethylaminomethyl-2-thiouridine(34) oxidoreductase MnmC [Ramlibacter rhizophilus]TFZ03355.1 FAD-dependent oxidoreductase [Ramlibacter rhizophilus]
MSAPIGGLRVALFLTGTGTPRDLLETWQAWQQDAPEAARLHLLAIEPWPKPAAEWLPDLPPALSALGARLGEAWWGLVPGLHRMAFERGRVTVSVFVGPAQDALRELAFTADEVHLGAAGAAVPRDAAALRPVARLCRRGTVLRASDADESLRHGLASAGFVIRHDRGESLEAIYAPAWTPRVRRGDARRGNERHGSEHAVVVGGGLAGAAVASSLARRGWRVQVIDAAAHPASGASALPAGLLAPHVSPDDNLLSRLSRAGLRLTRAEAQALLRPGVDWDGQGTLEHRIKPASRRKERDAPPADALESLLQRRPAVGFADDWSCAAGARHKQEALLPGNAAALWHARAAWIRPGALVRAWLDQPGIAWRGGLQVQRIEHDAGTWHLFDSNGRALADAPLLVVAAALGSAPLLDHRLLLHPVRGQVSWAPHRPGQRLPARPVNGNGHFLPAVPLDGGMAWMSGSSYGRGERELQPREADHQANFERIRTLLPAVADQLAPEFAAGRVQAWTGVRCASGDRRPLVGEIAPGLWVSTAMGSRGLTFAALCAELIASRLHEEPLPLPLSLAMALDAHR